MGEGASGRASPVAKDRSIDVMTSDIGPLAGTSLLWSSSMNARAASRAIARTRARTESERTPPLENAGASDVSVTAEVD